jgi:hypothetical protein
MILVDISLHISKRQLQEFLVVWYDGIMIISLREHSGITILVLETLSVRYMEAEPEIQQHIQNSGVDGIPLNVVAV